MAQTEIGIKFVNTKSKQKHIVNKSWSKLYWQDVEVLMRWLSLLVGLKECENPESSLDESSDMVIPLVRPLEPLTDFISRAIDTFLYYVFTFAFAECNRKKNLVTK